MRQIRLLSVLFFLFILTSCNEAIQSDSIEANSLINEDSLQLQLKVNNYVSTDDHATFFTNKDLYELQDHFEQGKKTEENLEFEVVNDSFLIVTKKTGDNKTFHYMIVQIGK